MLFQKCSTSFSTLQMGTNSFTEGLGWSGSFILLLLHLYHFIFAGVSTSITSIFIQGSKQVRKMAASGTYLHSKSKMCIFNRLSLYVD